MNTTVLLMSSFLLNVGLVAILWRCWRWRRLTLATMHALLKMIKINSACIRRVNAEPWKDENIRAAEDAVDRQFSIVFDFLNPGEGILLLDDKPKLPIPKEPGSDG